MKSASLRPDVRYSGRYRPAWRISQIGGGQTRLAGAAPAEAASLRSPYLSHNRKERIKEWMEVVIGAVNRVDRVVAPNRAQIFTAALPRKRLNQPDCSAASPDRPVTRERIPPQYIRTDAVDPRILAAGRTIVLAVPAIPAILSAMSGHRINLHLVSDATGETLNAIARATTVQFEHAEIVYHRWSLIRTRFQLHRVLEGIEHEPGPVLVHPGRSGAAGRAGDDLPAARCPGGERARSGDEPAAGLHRRGGRGAARAGSTC